MLRSWRFVNSVLVQGRMLAAPQTRVLREGTDKELLIAFFCLWVKWYRRGGAPGSSKIWVHALGKRAGGLLRYRWRRFDLIRVGGRLVQSPSKSKFMQHNIELEEFDPVWESPDRYIDHDMRVLVKKDELERLQALAAEIPEDYLVEEVREEFDLPEYTTPIKGR